MSRCFLFLLLAVASDCLVHPSPTWKQAASGPMAISTLSPRPLVARPPRNPLVMAVPERLQKLRGGSKTPEIFRQMAAEVLGTALLVIFGTGSVACAVFTGALTGLWQIAVVWAVGIALAIHLTGPISGAHLNPAVSLAFAVVRPSAFPMSKVLPYALAQFVGAGLGALINFSIFRKAIVAFEAAQGFTRGSLESVKSACAFGMYHGNYGLTAMDALYLEGLSTALLVMIIFSLTDAKNKSTEGASVPALIGLAVGALIALFGPLTQCGMNPARDLAPRLVSWALGWGGAAFSNAWWIYIVGPIVGALVGATLHEKVFSKYLSES